MGIYQKTHIYTYWSNLTASSSYGGTSNEPFPSPSPSTIPVTKPRTGTSPSQRTSKGHSQQIALPKNYQKGCLYRNYLITSTFSIRTYLSLIHSNIN